MMPVEQFHYNFDLKYNYEALCLVLIAPDFITPDKALISVGLLTSQLCSRGNNAYTEQDIEDMIKLKEQNVSWSELAEIYGVNRSTLFTAVKTYKQRKEAI